MRKVKMADNKIIERVASRWMRNIISNNILAEGEYKLGPSSGMVRGLRYGEDDEDLIEEKEAEFDPNMIGLPTVPQAYDHFTQREWGELRDRQQRDEWEKDYHYREI